MRMAMRKYGLLPDEAQFSFTGPDWLLLLLENCSSKERGKFSCK